MELICIRSYDMPASGEATNCTFSCDHFQFVFFLVLKYFSAWIHEDSIWPYVDFKSRFLLTTRIPRGYKEALESIEDCVKNLPKQVCDMIVISPVVNQTRKLTLRDGLT